MTNRDLKKHYRKSLRKNTIRSYKNLKRSIKRGSKESKTRHYTCTMTTEYEYFNCVYAAIRLFMYKHRDIDTELHYTRDKLNRDKYTVTFIVYYD